MNGENTVKVWYTTWGSYGQHSVAVAILKDGTVVDPSKIHPLPPKGMSVKRKIGEVEVEIENTSSRKNTHLAVHIPAEHVMAVLERTTTSSGAGPWTLKTGDGQIVVEDKAEEKEVAKNGRRYKTVETYYCYYYCVGDRKILFARELLRTETIPLDKPRVRVISMPSKIAVDGDTYDIKEYLKQCGFRWTGTRWEKQGTLEEARAIAEKLKEIAEVELTVDQGPLARALEHAEKLHQALIEHYQSSQSNELVKLIREAENLYLMLKIMVERGGSQ